MRARVGGDTNTPRTHKKDVSLSARMSSSGAVRVFLPIVVSITSNNINVAPSGSETVALQQFFPQALDSAANMINDGKWNGDLRFTSKALTVEQAMADKAYAPVVQKFAAAAATGRLRAQLKLIGVLVLDTTIRYPKQVTDVFGMGIDVLYTLGDLQELLAFVYGATLISRPISSGSLNKMAEFRCDVDQIIVQEEPLVTAPPAKAAKVRKTAVRKVSAPQPKKPSDSPRVGGGGGGVERKVVQLRVEIPVNVMLDDDLAEFYGPRFSQLVTPAVQNDILSHAAREVARSDWMKGLNLQVTIRPGFVAHNATSATLGHIVAQGPAEFPRAYRPSDVLAGMQKAQNLGLWLQNKYNRVNVYTYARSETTTGTGANNDDDEEEGYDDGYEGSVEITGQLDYSDLVFETKDLGLTDMSASVSSSAAVTAAPAPAPTAQGAAAPPNAVAYLLQFAVPIKIHMESEFGDDDALQDDYIDDELIGQVHERALNATNTIPNLAFFGFKARISDRAPEFYVRSMRTKTPTGSKLPTGSEYYGFLVIEGQVSATNYPLLSASMKKEIATALKDRELFYAEYTDENGAIVGADIDWEAHSLEWVPRMASASGRNASNITTKPYSPAPYKRNGLNDDDDDKDGSERTAEDVADFAQAMANSVQASMPNPLDFATPLDKLQFLKKVVAHSKLLAPFWRSISPNRVAQLQAAEDLLSVAVSPRLTFDADIVGMPSLRATMSVLKDILKERGLDADVRYLLAV